MSLDVFFTYFFSRLEEQTRGVSIISFVATALIGILIANMIWIVMERKFDKVVFVEKKRIIIAFIIYASLAYQITFDRRTPGSKTGIYTELDFGSLRGNFYKAQQVIYTLLNVLLFVPFGFLAGMLKKECFWLKRIVLCTLYSFLVSFGIECVQLLTQRGYFEVTDLVTNVMGGLCGVLFISIVYAWKKPDIS